MVATFSTLQGQGPRGRPFQKGMEKSAGRKKGVQNIHTRTVRMAIAEAARGLGGVRRLIEWAKEDAQNERAFWTSIWPRLLPLQIQGSGDRGEIEINLQITPEELDKALEERGLPTTIFGIDTPVLEAAPQPLIEANGIED
jgi:hypothetical protein